VPFELRPKPTGHEAKGPMIDEYKDRFQRQSFNHFESLIADYNGLITSSQLVDAIHVYLDKIEQDKTPFSVSP
jgi:hypothetical protein